MSKPAPLDALTGFMAAEKGRAVPTPDAALPSPAAPPPGAEPKLAEFVQPGQGRTARIQIGVRLDRDRFEQLRRISFEMRQTTQAIMEQLICGWMDEHDQGGRG